MPILLLRLLWIALLVLPNLSTIAFANAWEADPRVLCVTGACVVVLLYGLLSARAFLAVTFPIIVAGLMVLGADWNASVNMVELLSVANTFKPGEVASALRPYVPVLVAGVLAVAALFVVLWRADRRPGPARATKAPLLVAGLLAAVALPAPTWFATWPVNLLPAVAAAQEIDVGIELSYLKDRRVSPRDRFRSWNAARPSPPAEDETYVLVIGETVRSDRVPGCGGRREVHPPPADALLYCDVLAGSSGSHTAVPLLVSRELPGRVERVGRDATFLKAFEAAGFETFWLALQERAVAWPDARNQWYHLEPGLDRELLLPQLELALAKPARRKMIVLHAYNAHSPYVDRYRAAGAPFPADPARVASDQAVRWNAYDNAIDESMRFLGAVVDRLRATQGHVVLVYTPDHAENMHDDSRRLLDHALKFPTLWDTRVPAIVWANVQWKQANPQKWQVLASNQDKSLMHMDIAPTMLGAAGIRYDEPRKLPVDLTSQVAGPRQRITQARAGVAVDVETLRREAGVVPN